MAEPSYSLDSALTSQLEIGKGQYQIISGSISWPGHTLAAIELLAPVKDKAKLEWAKNTGGVDIRFRLSISWKPEDIEHHQPVSLQLSDDVQQSTVLDLGETELTEVRPSQLKAGQQIGDDPLIAICMASYQPDPARLMRQIESMLCQSYQNWLLIISDDASDHDKLQQVEALCNLDPRRIRLIRNADRVGFYHNFERALQQVPTSALMVALADQDDEWYPEKLRKLADRLNAEDAPVLVYSDMHIVDERGSLIAGSFWGARKNEYRDFDSLLLNNTVSGAATLFRHDLLDTLLPFPAKLGGMFHDHWLACVAGSVGKLAYIDEPLYDYYQYHDSVIGHRTTALAEVSPSNASLPEDKWAKREQGYVNDCLRIQVVADTIKLRVPAATGRPGLNLMNGGPWSIIKLFKTYLKGLLFGRTRGGAELALIMGFMAHERQKRRNQGG